MIKADLLTSHRVSSAEAAIIPVKHKNKTQRMKVRRDKRVWTEAKRNGKNKS